MVKGVVRDNTLQFGSSDISLLCVSKVRVYAPYEPESIVRKIFRYNTFYKKQQPHCISFITKEEKCLLQH